MSNPRQKFTEKVLAVRELLALHPSDEIQNSQEAELERRIKNIPICTDGLVDMAAIDADLRNAVHMISAAIERESTDVDRTSASLGDYMRELSELLADFVRSFKLGSVLVTDAEELFELFLNRIHRDSSCARSVVKAADRLVEFAELYSGIIARHARYLGGIKLAVIDDPYGNHWSPEALSLLADTQLLDDQITPLLSKRVPSAAGIASAAVMATKVLRFRPLIDCHLRISPLVMLDFRILCDEDEDSEEILTNAYLDAWRDREMLFVWTFDRSTYFAAQPVVVGPFARKIYSSFNRSVVFDLIKSGYLAEETNTVCNALQRHQFSWLRNIPIAALPQLLSQQEHLMFREKLLKIVRDFNSSSINDIDEITRHVSQGLQILLAERDASIRKIQEKYRPKMSGLAISSAVGVCAVGGVASLSPVLGSPVNSIAGLIVGSATATSVLGAAGVSYFKTKIELELEKRQIRRSLLGVLATANSQGMSPGRDLNQWLDTTIKSK
jgi:hypothetical protein